MLAASARSQGQRNPGASLSLFIAGKAQLLGSRMICLSNHGGIYFVQKVAAEWETNEQGERCATLANLICRHAQVRRDGCCCGRQ